MAHASVLGLPNELLHEIAGYFDTPDLLILCQTNRRIHYVALKWIYRIVNLDDPARLVKCCQTFISRLEAADSVYELTIVLSEPRFGLGSFHRTIAGAFGRLKNLRILNISRSPAIFRSLLGIQFPRLLHCGLPLVKEIVPFLQRNPWISGLMVLPLDSYSMHLPFRLPAHILPKLQRFVGPASVACSIIPGSVTHSATIYWEHDQTLSFSDGLAAVARSQVEVTHFTTLLGSWDCSILPAIVDRMPRVEYLEFRIFGDFAEKEAFFSSVDAILHDLPCLESLDLFEGSPTNSHEDTLEDEFEIVRRWGDHSPSLSFVTFPSRQTRWARWRGGWIPCLDALDDCINYKWFLKTVVSRPTLPPTYAGMAEYLVGTHGILAVWAALQRGEAVPDFVLLEGGLPWVIVPPDSDA
ncbi:hypothetical protein B0H11DRAFT_2063297 [Mycena galericulata]|nr:hypothetical protein B0H11DRAFT_2063297 [Mycena galericulata]